MNVIGLFRRVLSILILVVGIVLCSIGIVDATTNYSPSLDNLRCLSSDNESDRFKIAARTQGIVEFIGQPVSRTEGKDARGLIEVQIAGKPAKIRTLRNGDLVEKDQVIGLINDDIMQAELRIQQAKLVITEAELASSERVMAEAYRRWQDRKQLAKFKQTSKDEVKDAENTHVRYSSEVESKKAAIEIAKKEIELVRATLESHLIRSSVRGIVRRVHKYPGEAVRKLETVVTLDIVNDDSN